MNFDLLSANRESKIENEAMRKEKEEKAASSFIAGQQPVFFFFGDCKNETKMSDAKESKVACLVVSLGQGRRQQQKPQQHKMESTKSAGARQEKEATTIKRKLAPKKEEKTPNCLRAMPRRVPINMYVCVLSILYK